MIRRQHVVPDFFEEGEALREIMDARFRDRYTDRIPWYYFCDPRMYTYFRTAPKDVFPKEIFDKFMKHLRLWCLENLGLAPMSLPYLHLMVNGCRLGLHSDFHNGAWGYVYSLTRWDQRKFAGGETLLLRDGVPSYKKHHVHGEVLYELIPAQFNQLLVFDDRIVHGTPTIEGSMDPLDGRIAMVGHIRATSPVVISGAIQPMGARGVILQALLHLRDRLRGFKDVQGTVTYKITISMAGDVESISVLTDNIVTPFTGYEHSEPVAAAKALIQETMAALRFPSAANKSVLIAPVLVPLPDLRSIEFAVPHHSSPDSIYERAIMRFGEIDELEFQGNWQGRECVVSEPIAGRIRIESDHMAFYFDPPMWVPSQRERFRTTLTEWANSCIA